MERFKLIAIITVIIFGITVGGTFSFFVCRALIYREEWCAKLIETNPKLCIFLPISAIGSYAVVTLLEYRSGRIKFSIGSMKFEGAAGSIIFWILCFVSISLVIKLI